MNIKAVVFDMDGVIIDSEYVYLIWLKDFLSYMGKEYAEEELYKVVGTSVKTTNRMLAQYLDYKYTPEVAGELADEYYRKFKRIDYRQILKSNVLTILELLKEQHYLIALASSSPLNNIKDVLKQCDIQDYFDIIVSGEMFKESKPEPAIYNFTANKLGVNNEQCLVIEDSTIGILAASRANMNVVAIKEHRFAQDQTLAMLQIEDLLEIRNVLKF